MSDLLPKSWVIKKIVKTQWHAKNLIESEDNEFIK